MCRNPLTVIMAIVQDFKKTKMIICIISVPQIGFLLFKNINSLINDHYFKRYAVRKSIRNMIHQVDTDLCFPKK